MKKLLLLFLFSCTCYSAMASVSSVTQHGWRWRNDNGSETSATWAADKGQKFVLTSKDDNIRLRLSFKIDYAGCCTGFKVNSRLSYSISPDGPFVKISTLASANEHFVFSHSEFVGNHTSTTQQISDDAFLFAGGRVVAKADTDDGSILFGTNEGNSQYGEYEWVIKPTPDIKEGTYYFKLEGLHDYNTLATLIFNAPAPDETPPNAIISSTRKSPTNANPIPVTIAFDEEVENFTQKKLVVSNGTVNSLEAPGSGYLTTIGKSSSTPFPFSVTPLGVGTTEFEFGNTWGVAYDQAGKIYVVDNDKNQVQVFNVDYTHFGTIGTGTGGSANDQLSSPMAIAVDSKGKIYVADHANHRVQIFNPDLTYFATLGTGSFGTGNHQFANPWGVAVDGVGKIYVADAGNYRVQIFNADLTYAATIGTPGVSGSTNNHFGLPNDVSVDHTGKIYVSDRPNYRVQIFNPDYSYAATLGTTGSVGSGTYQFNSPCGTAIDAFGNIYVADQGNHRIQIFNNDYTYLKTIGTGTFGSGNNQLNHPADVAVIDGKISISDHGNKRIQVFSYNDAYVAYITPAADGLVTVNLPAGAVTDKAGNGNIAAEQFSILYDGTAPTLVISSTASPSTGESSFPVTFTFSEEVEGFSQKDVIVDNGAILDWSTTDNIIFSATIEAENYGDVMINVKKEVARDKAGNFNIAAEEFSIKYADTISPNVFIFSKEPDPTNNAEILISIQFDELIKGFSKDDLVVGNGSIVSISTEQIGYSATIGKAGKPGAANDQLNSPFGVAAGRDGKVYVPDQLNHRVQVFNADHTYSGTIGVTGNPGSAIGQFNRPFAAAVGAQGNIYVVEYGNNRVQIFNNHLEYVATIGGVQGNGMYEFSGPTGIAVDSEGNIYVADQGNHRIQIYNSSLAHVSTIGITGTSGSDNKHLNYPFGVAVDKAGNIFISDQVNHRVQLFDANRNYIATIGTGIGGNDEEQLRNPGGVAIDDNGMIYITELGACRA